jgi:hypothetical protein
MVLQVLWLKAVVRLTFLEIASVFIAAQLHCWHPGKPFTYDWQDYCTRKDCSLKTISDAGYQYPAPDQYTACVKVVDTFGCDTSITVEVEV